MRNALQCEEKLPLNLLPVSPLILKLSVQETSDNDAVHFSTYWYWLFLGMCKFGCNDFLVWTSSARTCYWKRDQHWLALLCWQAFPVSDACFLCCWSQREKAEMEVGIGKAGVRCKDVNLSILITATVAVRDTAKIKYAACLRDLYIQLLLVCYLTS